MLENSPYEIFGQRGHQCLILLVRLQVYILDIPIDVVLRLRVLHWLEWACASQELVCQDTDRPVVNFVIVGHFRQKFGSQVIRSSTKSHSVFVY